MFEERSWRRFECPNEDTDVNTPYCSLQSDGDTIEAHAIITACTPREAKYLLEHLLDMALNWVSEGGTEEGVGGRGGGEG